MFNYCYIINNVSFFIKCYLIINNCCTGIRLTNSGMFLTTVSFLTGDTGLSPPRFQDIKIINIINIIIINNNEMINFLI